MFFVGPHPPLTYRPWPIDEYTYEQKRMLEIRPGVTGWVAYLLIETDWTIKIVELMMLKCGREYAVIFEYMGMSSAEVNMDYNQLYII